MNESRVTSATHYCYELVEITGTMEMFLCSSCHNFFGGFYLIGECFLSFPTHIILIIDDISDAFKRKKKKKEKEKRAKQKCDPLYRAFCVCSPSII